MKLTDSKKFQIVVRLHKSIDKISTIFSVGVFALATVIKYGVCNSWTCALGTGLTALIVVSLVALLVRFFVHGYAKKLIARQAAQLDDAQSDVDDVQNVEDK